MQLYNKERDKKYIIFFLILGFSIILFAVIGNKLADRNDNGFSVIEDQSESWRNAERFAEKDQ